MREFNLTDLEKDALKEVANIGAGNAATALSQLMNRKINIEVPEIYFLPIEEVPEMVGKDKAVVGLVVKVLGDFPSVILFVFSHQDAFNLASLMTGRKSSNGGVITGLERSALGEIGIILANAYLGALSLFLKWGLVPRVPEVIEDMAEALIDYLLIELSDLSPYALVIKSEFKEATTNIVGHFFLIPNSRG